MQRLRFFLILLCTALAGCRPAAAPAPPEAQTPAIMRQYQAEHASLTLRIPRDRATVADAIEVEVDLAFPEGWQPRMTPPSTPDLPAGPMETGRPELGDDHRLNQRLHLRYTPFLPGDFLIGPLSVTLIKGKDEAAETITTDAVPVTVTSLLHNGEQTPADILPVRSLPRPIWPWIALGAGMLAVIAVAATLYLRRRRRPVPPPPPLPPHRLAERQLDDLASRRLPEQGQGKLFYELLSGILRAYIEARFAIRAPELTTEEFLAELSRDNRLVADHKNALQRVLSHCDMVKFAKLQATPADCAQSLALCRGFVRETNPAAAAGEGS